jgi:hypothetical protein
MPESNVKQIVPFLWIRDTTTSLHFYVEGLGFKMTKKWLDEGVVRWCRLELGDASLMLQQFWTAGPHRSRKRCFQRATSPGS